MKIKSIVLCCLWLYIGLAFSQEISLTYGDITIDELNMTSYANDTSAVAVVLYENGKTSYEYSSVLEQVFDMQEKIKILKPEGSNQGDIAITYFVGNGVSGESISKLEAFSYNLENGQIIKTALEKQYIFDEKVSDHIRQIKFSIPNVKTGTVIEYKYRKTTPAIFNIPTWYVQRDIPVLNSFYEARIPEKFLFKVDAMKGFEHIQVEESTEFNNRIGHLRVIKVTAKEMPPIKAEPYVWCLNDLKSGVGFEFNGIALAAANSWKDIAKLLKDKSDFGSNMRMSNPYKDEVKYIVQNAKSEDEIITQIYSLIKEKIRWNETYSFAGNNAREAVKNGTGNNGQINMILLSMLKDAKIKAYPVLVSTRDNGRLSLIRPSLDKINTFIVVAETSDGLRNIYMDGSAIYGGVDVLPPTLLVDRARLLKENETGGEWVNLTNLGRNQKMTQMKATINEEGTMHCEQATRYTNQVAYQFKSDYFAAKDSIEYIENYSTENKITVSSHSLEGLNPMSNVVNEKITFTKNLEPTGDFMYVNPMIFAHLEENPFTQSERKLPIELDYPYSYTTSTTITVPQNYTIDEIPAALHIILPNNAGKCVYEIKKVNDTTIQANYRFELNQILFPQTDYEFLREFYGQITAKNTALVVLKKK
jgi:hypothetical protein